VYVCGRKKKKGKKHAWPCLPSPWMRPRERGPLELSSLHSPSRAVSQWLVIDSEWVRTLALLSARINPHFTSAVGSDWQWREGGEHAHANHHQDHSLTMGLFSWWKILRKFL
jgi:hypothetical protein